MLDPRPPSHPGSAGAAERVAELVLGRPPSAGAVRVLAVDGPSGSGKSTLAAAVVATLLARGTDARLLRLDDVYPGWDGLAAAATTTAGLLADLAAGRPACYRSWDWAADGWGPVVDVALPGAGGVLVVEGSGCGTRAAAAHLTVLVWVEAAGGEPERHARAMTRDGEGYRPHWERWAAQERETFATEGTRGRADLVVRT